MAFTAYATVPELKAWITLPDTVDDVVISDVLDTVTVWADEHCDRHFWQDGTVGTPVARTFAPCDPWVLNLGAFSDLVSATTVKTDESGDGTFETTWASSDYELQPISRPTGRPYTRIEAIAGRLFPVRYARGDGTSARVQITGIWGWSAIPETVKQACLIQGSRILKRRYSPEGVAGFGDFGAVRVTRLDPDVMALLDPFRRKGVRVA